jgi:hypothetical protein
LDDGLHLLFPHTGLLLVLHHLSPLSLIYPLQFSLLANGLPLLVLQALNTLLLFVKPFLQLALLYEGIIKPRLKGLNLPVILFRHLFSLL